MTTAPGHAYPDRQPEGRAEGLGGAEPPGPWLRHLRRAAGLTQEELAARAGLGVRTISDLERGVRSPYPRSLRLVAGALGMTETAADQLIAWYRGAGNGVTVRSRQAANDHSEELPPVPLDAHPGPGGGAPAVIPRQLPTASAYFAGRTAELAILDRWAEQVPGTDGAVAISVICGMAGVGKTALALRWAHRAAKQFPDGQLYANLQGFSPAGEPADPAVVIAGFLEALGIPPSGIPASPLAQAGLYRSLLAGKRMVVVLDDARDPAQVRPLLPGSDDCPVLVTSRSQLSALAAVEGARLVDLDTLTEADARELLARRLGARRVAAEPETVTELVSLCDGLPLALAIVAARAAARPRFPLAALTTELHPSGGSPLDALDAGHATADLRAVFSWSYDRLSPAAARMFRLLGLHRGPDISRAAAASLAGISRGQARRDLTELAHAHLATEPAAGRYALHDLLRAFAAEQATTTDGEADRLAAIGRVLDHYLHTAHAGSLLFSPLRGPVSLAPPHALVKPEDLASAEQARDWFDTEHQVLMSAVSLAASTGFDTCAWQLPWAMTTALDRRGRWPEQAAILRTALSAATRLRDAAAQAAVRRSLATALTQLGDYEQAQAHLARSLELYQQARDHLGQARVLHTLGWLANQQGHDAIALAYAEQAMALCRAIGDRDGEAVSLNSAGWCHIMLGDLAHAQQYCQQALTISRQLGNRYNEAASLDSLGQIHHQLGHLAEAATCYQQARSIFHQIDRFYEADTLTHLGDTYQAASDPAAARDAWQQAFAILNDLRHPNAAKLRAKLDPDEASGGSVKLTGGLSLHTALRGADQLIRWAKFTMTPSGPRTDAMRQMLSY